MPLRIINLFATRGFVVGLNFLSLLVVAAIMDPAAFGKFVFMWSCAQFLAAIAGFGGINYLMREGSARQGDPARGVSAAEALMIALVWPLAALIAASGLIWGGSLLLAPMLDFNTLGFADIAAVCAAAFALNLLGHSATALRLNEWHTISMVLRDATPQFLILVIVAVSAMSGIIETPRVFFVFLIAAVAVGLCVCLASRFLRTPLWRDTQGNRGAGQVKFWGNSILGIGVTQFDILLGGLFVGDAALGHYQILKRLANLIGLPQTVANWGAIVKIGRDFAAGEIDAVRAACKESVVWSFFPGLALCMGMATTLPLFIDYYELPQSNLTWTVFWLLAIGNLINLGHGVNFILASQSGLEGAALLARVGGLSVSCGVIFAFGPSAGQHAMAAAVLLGLLISNVAMSSILRKKHSVETSLLALKN